MLIKATDFSSWRIISIFTYCVFSSKYVLLIHGWGDSLAIFELIMHGYFRPLLDNQKESKNQCIKRPVPAKSSRWLVEDVVDIRRRIARDWCASLRLAHPGELQLVMQGGKTVARQPALIETREYARRQLNGLPMTLRQLSNTPEYPVIISAELQALAKTVDERNTGWKPSWCFDIRFKISCKTSELDLTVSKYLLGLSLALTVSVRP